ncbi:MAG: BtpA/SgcQ family protein [Chloroflexi bacterium]|nr:BtpA/SgcQ family protein [Chloroflexota bacterium]
MRARGAVPSSNVLAFGVVPAVQHAADQLGIQEGSDVLRLERLRFADGEPIGVQVTLLPAAGLRPLVAVDFARESLYEQLERQFGIVIDDAEEVFTSTILDQTTAQLLLVSFPSPGFLVERVASSRGRGVEYTRSVMRGDRYRVQVHLRRGTRSLGRHGSPSRAGSSSMCSRISEPASIGGPGRTCLWRLWPGRTPMLSRLAATTRADLTSTSVASVSTALDFADAVIVGTSLKLDGCTWNPIDPDRAKAFMSRVREARGF